MATFIDGQAGTTGIEQPRLRAREDLKLLTIAEDERRSGGARKVLQQADAAILCLPDDAAISACELANGQCRLLDAFTAHRTHSDWVRFTRT